MRKPLLDPRLATAADFFPYCEMGADVGADHGHLSCYLLASGKCARMQVTDVSEDSLAKAKRLFAMHEMDDRAIFCCGDGLDALKAPAQAIAICGMGGQTLSGILRRGKDKLNNAVLVLSPQTEHTKVRETVYCDLGYHITREQVIWAANRYYIMIRAEAGKKEITEREMYLGPCLVKCREHMYLDYLKWRIDVVACEKHEKAKIYLMWLKEEWDRVRECIDSTES